MKGWFIDFVLKQRWLLVFLTAIAVLISIPGLGRLVINGEADSMMDEDYHAMVEHYRLQSDFTGSTNLQILIHANQFDGEANNKDQLFKPRVLALVRELTEQAWQIPNATRVDSITNFQHIEARGYDDLVIDALLPLDEEITVATAARVKQVALNETSLLNQLVSENGNLTAVNVDIGFPQDEDRGKLNDSIIQFAENWLEPYRTEYSELEIMLAGTVMIDYASFHHAERDSQTLIPLMLLLIVVMLLLMMRSLSITLAAAFIVLLTGLITMGVVGWLGVELNMLSAISPIVIMTLAVADVTHFSVGMINGMRSGKNKRDAIAYSLDLNLWPIFLTSLTTILGVITFSFSDNPPLRAIGIIIAIGVAVAFLLSVTLLPAVLSFVRVRRVAAYRRSVFAKHYVDWLITHHVMILVLGGILSVSLAISSLQMQLNDSPERFFKPHTPVGQAMTLLGSEMSGAVRYELAIYSDEADGISSPEFLRNLDEYKDWALAQPGIEHVHAITDTFKRLNQNMHGGEKEWYRLPEQRDLAAQYLLLYELSLPYGLDLANQINNDKSATRLFITTHDMQGEESVRWKNQTIDWFASRDPAVEVAFGGIPLVMTELAYVHLMPSLGKGGGIAFAMIALVLVLVLKNWRYGLVGAIANLLPVAMGYGVWALINGTAGMGEMCVAGVCLGVVIDFAVHFLNKYRNARNQSQSPEDSVRYAFEKVALPLWTTTVVLVSGFWLLTFSPISLNSNLGLLTGIIILLAFLFDLLILPALLIWSEKRLVGTRSTAGV